MDVYKLDKFEHIYAVDCFDKEFSKMTNERLSETKSKGNICVLYG